MNMTAQCDTVQPNQNKLDTALNESYKVIIGCLKPIPIGNMLLSRNHTQSHTTWRKVAASTERSKASILIFIRDGHEPWFEGLYTQHHRCCAFPSPTSLSEWVISQQDGQGHLCSCLGPAKQPKRRRRGVCAS